MRQRVLVCGGRNYADRKSLYHVLDVAHAANPIDLLIAGGANGADSLANDWARGERVPRMIIKADWKAQGAAAGPIRNQRMLDDGKPHLVIAFPGGRGTADMIQRAEAQGVPVVRFTAVVGGSSEKHR